MKYRTKDTNVATTEVCHISASIMLTLFRITCCYDRFSILQNVLRYVPCFYIRWRRLSLLSGLLMTIINLAYVFANPAEKCAPDQLKKDNDNTNSRANLLMAGLWWGVFSIFVLCGLKSRPGPSLPNLKAYIVTPWKRLWYTFRC